MFMKSPLNFKVECTIPDSVLDKIRLLREGYIKVFPLFLESIPQGYPLAGLDNLKYRVFNFPPKEDNYEFFEIVKGNPYVCLDVKLVKKDFYRAFEYFCHGVTHAFSFFEPSFFGYDFLVEEMFCEVMGYRALIRLLRGNEKKESIIQTAKNNSPSAYTKLVEIGFRLEHREPGFLAKLNTRLYQSKKRAFTKRRVAEQQIEKEFIQRCARINITEKDLMMIGKSLKSDKMMDLEKNFVLF